MRTDKQLLQITFDELWEAEDHEKFDCWLVAGKYKCSGLCGMPMALTLAKFIDLDECKRLLRLIKDLLKQDGYTGNAFAWSIGSRGPRIDWLEQKISKL